ncbi:dipeptide epimerase [Aeoliella mucimassa]|uniref:Dipeptide epimerase n=1 Tax=Aeoliella mucimassa TaxID=2527972 RepID=A0A518AS80_9BACT|nr:dipeptide epimerase [Aeoliella mucimassa]QDU57580.1 L-Ala-D/L-Glu epimerase [Aeoliella mucimassa]
MDLAYRVYELPLRHTFTIARGSTNVQPTFIVQLHESGEYGYGEATTNSYYNASAEQMASAVERVRPLLASSSARDPEPLLAELASQLPEDSFALSALDQALHDLWGKLLGKPVYELWGLDLSTAPPSDYTIGIDTIDTMVAKLEEMPGWPVYKIKLGTDNDIEIVKALREHTDATLRVDANCGWTAEQTIEYSPILKELGVEFIEQPLPADDHEGARLAYEGSALPLIADESCVVESDVEKCAGKFHGINIKLVKCGGLAPARRMVAKARELGLKLMAGCMTESSVGISALAQLLPMLDYIDMDGAVLLAEDIAEGVKVEKGICHFSDRNGTGAQLLTGPLT